MKICLYGSFFTSPVVKSLEQDGHSVIYNKFSKDLDVIISQSINYMYPLQRLMKRIKKHKIKLITITPDIPPWRIFNNYSNNSFMEYSRQELYHLTHKNQNLYDIVNRINDFSFKTPIFHYISQYNNKIFNTNIANKIFYINNYRAFLKKSDLNLSFSKFSKKLIKKYLKIQTKVWYPCANTELIKNLPTNLEQKYDAINISRIVPHKHQKVFVKAAKKLNLKIAIIGPHQDKSIELDCPHFALPHKEALKSLILSKIYVDPSSFEGFGMTPVEAAFLNKITVASDISVHREVLNDYPLYFRTGDVKDLIEKISMVREGQFSLDKSAVLNIKKKYSINASKQKLIEYIESIM